MQRFSTISRARSFQVPVKTLQSEKLPALTSRVQTSGTILTSGNVKIHSGTTLVGSSSVSRFASGGRIFYDSFSGSSNDYILVSPLDPLEQMTRVEMDGSLDWTLRPSSLLALNGPLIVQVQVPAHMNFFRYPWLFYRVSGQGSLCLTGLGALHHRELSSDDTVLVDPRHLIAWDSAVDLSFVNPSTLSFSPPEPVIEPLNVTWWGRIVRPVKKAYHSVMNVPNLVGKLPETAQQFLSKTLSNVSFGFQSLVLDQKGFVQVKGPGSIIVASSRSASIWSFISSNMSTRRSASS